MSRLLQSLIVCVALLMPANELSAQGIRDSVELEPVVVTATHSPKALKDAPVVTRLITLHDIKITDATNIQEMLTQEIPGLEFGFAMAQETSLNMSGFGGNAVLFLVDGERLAGETMDNTDYNRLNLDNVGRSTPASTPSEMNGVTVPVSLSTRRNGTLIQPFNTRRSILSTCPRHTRLRRSPSN